MSRTVGVPSARGHFCCAAVVLACLLAPLASSAQKPPNAAAKELPVPADLVEQVARSSEIGRLLYVLDRVAAIGTDALLAEVPDLERHGVAGYIPVQESGDDGTPKASFLVNFYTGETPPRTAYTVRVAPGTKPVVDTFLPPLDTVPGFAAFVRARQVAIAAADLSGQPLNPVLIPAEAIGEKGILVYLLAGTTKPDVVVLGRHTRVLVSEDGTRVVATTPLTQAVIEAPTRGSAAALVVTHVLTDYPVETDVFASLLSKLPIYVLTKSGAWRVNGEEIAFLGDQQPDKKE